MRLLRRLLTAAMFGVSAAVGHGQVDWREHPALLPREGHAMVFDSARNVVVLFGGQSSRQETNQLSLWDGTRWTHPQVAPGPLARSEHAMAYDSVRQRVVMFGGTSRGRGLLNDTWEWDGSVWRPMYPASLPAPRWGHAMVYDAARQRCVLFSGYQSSVVLPDTWTWDGTNWRQLPVAGPPGRVDHSMVYDDRRGRVVLFGGALQWSVTFGDCWEWDGTQWTPNLAAPGPFARSEATMYFDTRRLRTVLFGGRGNGPFEFGDTWSFDGTTWSAVAPPVAPAPRRNSAAAYDIARDRGVLAGGFAPSAGVTADTWTFDGATWQERPRQSPAPRAGHMLGFDGTGVMLFGGVGELRGHHVDTWRFVDDAWTELRPSVAPPARSDASVAWDEARRRLVMFGGWDTASLPRGDTWEWDGSQWTLMAPLVSPPARAGAAMAYDPVQRRILLHGGKAGSDWRDLWGYDGTTWTLIHGAGPGGVGRLAYEEQSDAFVFKEIGVFTVVATWRWDRVRWTQLRPATEAPLLSYGASMVGDSARDRVVLATETGVDSLTTWEWDGATWAQRYARSAAPISREDPVLGYDPKRGTAVLFGGSGWSGAFGDTWSYGPYRPATFTTHYVSCPYSAAAPRLDSNGARPWLGDTFTIRVTGLQPNSPCVLLLGESATRLSGVIPLPLELSPLGISGCWLYTDIVVAAPMAMAHGVATWTVRIAGVPLGQRFHCQGLFADPLANPAGLGLTNAAVAVVGAR